MRSLFLACLCVCKDKLILYPQHKSLEYAMVPVRDRVKVNLMSTYLRLS